MLTLRLRFPRRIIIKGIELSSKREQICVQGVCSACAKLVCPYLYLYLICLLSYLHFYTSISFLSKPHVQTLHLDTVTSVPKIFFARGYGLFKRKLQLFVAPLKSDINAVEKTRASCSNYSGLSRYPKSRWPRIKKKHLQKQEPACFEFHTYRR